MKMENIPTAKEFLEFRTPRGIPNDYKEYWEAMIEFAKLHRKAILNAVVEKVEVIEGWNSGLAGNAASVDKNSIINSYPETNIK